MQVPTGLEIANFVETNIIGQYAKVQSCDGYDLTRDGDEYCYLWMEAFVDFDFVYHVLIDVRTHNGIEEDRTYLAVSTGLAKKVWAWHDFSYHDHDSGYRFVHGMNWFTNFIASNMEDSFYV